MRAPRLSCCFAVLRLAIGYQFPEIASPKVGGKIAGYQCCNVSLVIFQNTFQSGLNFLFFRPTFISVPILIVGTGGESLHVENRKQLPFYS